MGASVSVQFVQLVQFDVKVFSSFEFDRTELSNYVFLS